VLTRDGFHEVAAAWCASESAEVFEVESASGATVRGTSEHLFWTEFGWTRIDALRPGHRLTMSDGTESHIVSVRPTGTACVYDLTVEGAHEFFANGVLVHNCADALRYGCHTHFFSKRRGGSRLEAGSHEARGG
jgi:intein/homing endonuclease